MAIDIVRGAIKNQIASADLIETINGVQNEYTGNSIFGISTIGDGRKCCDY